MTSPSSSTRSTSYYILYAIVSFSVIVSLFYSEECTIYIGAVGPKSPKSYTSNFLDYPE